MPYFLFCKKLKEEKLNNKDNTKLTDKEMGKIWKT